MHLVSLIFDHKLFQFILAPRTRRADNNSGVAGKPTGRTGNPLLSVLLDVGHQECCTREPERQTFRSTLIRESHSFCRSLWRTMWGIDCMRDVPKVASAGWHFSTSGRVVHLPQPLGVGSGRDFNFGCFRRGFCVRRAVPTIRFPSSVERSRSCRNHLSGQSRNS